MGDLRKGKKDYAKRKLYPVHINTLLTYTIDQMKRLGN
jgi:hypothetical protein